MLRVLLTFILIFATTQMAPAKDIPVEAKALVKMSTSNVNLHEGDSINLVVAKDVYINSKLYIKEGTHIEGVITSLVDNGFTCQEASIYAENFKVKTTDGHTINLSGIVYKSGHDHSMFTQFLPFIFVFIRGGEAHILPEKDVFTLYAVEKI